MSTDNEYEYHVLLVESDDREQHIIEDALNKNNIRVTHCIANEALAEIEKQTYDALVIDHIVRQEYQMVGISGIDLCKELLGKNLFLPILLLIEYGTENTGLDAIKRGVDYLIKDEKQFYIELLPAVVQKMIKISSEYLNTKTMLKEYRLIIEAIPDPIYICSFDYRIAYMNPAMIQRTGRDAKGEFCYKSVHDRDEECPWCLIWKIHKNESFEMEICSPKDSRFYHISSSPIIYQGILSKLSICKDITEHKRAEEELKTARQALEAGFRSKNEFMANISHEFRTPLNAVIGMLDLALSTDFDRDRREFLKTAVGATDIMFELINTILDFSEIDTTCIKLKEDNVDLNRLLEGMTKAFLAKARQKRLELSLKIMPDVARYIRIDPHCLRQIMANIVDNAIRFTEKGKVEIKVQQESKTHLHFAISDTGAGIPSDMMGRIFTRTADTVKSPASRTGRGMTICKQLVHLMGGRIWAESRIGIGSTFYFTIKALQGQGKDPHLIFSDEAGQIPPAKNTLRILMAEDNAFNQKLALTLLNSRGHEVFVAENGKEAVKAYGKGKFDLILMDIQMPEMDGLTATRIIREKEKKIGAKHIPIIAVTAYAMPGDKERCLASGMDNYIAKPIRQDEFLRVVEGIDMPACDPRISDHIQDSQHDVFNQQMMLKIVGGNMDMLKQIIKLYLKNLPNQLAKVRDGIEACDAKKLEFEAHALKGMSLNVSAPSVSRIALDLEKIGRSGDMTESHEIFALLEKEAEILKSKLLELIN